MNDQPPPKVVRGVLTRVRFQSDDEEFCVAELEADDGGLLTIVGNLLGTRIGEHVEVVGRTKLHPKFGQQLEIEGIHGVVPTSPAAIERYLASGLIEGIGPVMAAKIVRHFGAETLDIIDADPGRLREVPGIGAVRASNIAAAWDDQRAVRSVMIFLQQHGISPRFASRIYKRYGSASIEIIKRNPYRLAADISGIGFRKADLIAREAGFAVEAPERLRAGMVFALVTAHDDGHVYLPRRELLSRSCKLLAVDEELVDAEVGWLVDNQRVVVERTENDDLFFRIAAWEAEQDGARHLSRLVKHGRRFMVRSVEHQLSGVENRLGFLLAPAQKQAVQSAWLNKVSVITGGPGTGKTTIVRAVCALGDALDQKIVLAAPTGRAAKRLSEATSRAATTIHRMLEYNPQEGGFQRDADNPLQADMVIIDETSMVDVYLFAALMAAVPSHAGLLLVGDVDQLPSVGPGNVLSDVISSEAVQVVRLTEIFRQAEQSNIVLNAHRINAGQTPALPARGDDLADFYFVGTEDAQVAQQRVLQLVTDRIPTAFGFEPLSDVQVLSPMYRGPVGCDALNAVLQAHFTSGATELRRGDTLWRVGDKVMQLRNNYDRDIFNGDIGTIVEINTRTKHVGVRFEQRLIPLEYNDLDELALAYAITVHKSQGSEYPAVVLPLMTTHWVMLQRNLLYTAVTRATKLCILVGSRRALDRAIANDQSQNRYSRLDERLRDLSSDGPLFDKR